MQVSIIKYKIKTKLELQPLRVLMRKEEQSVLKVNPALKNDWALKKETTNLSEKAAACYI